MPSVTLRKSLLAVAICATLPSHAMAELICNGPGQCIINSNTDLVTVGAATTLNAGGGIGLFVNQDAGNSITVGRVSNSGTIQGGFGLAIYFISTLNVLDNNGTINGAEHGVYSNGGHLGVLNNNGTISATGDAAIVFNSIPADITINQNNGSISGHGDAIRITAPTGEATLNWNGGNINGNLVGLKTFNLNLEHANLAGNLTMADNSTIRMRLTADNNQPILTLNGGAGSFNLGNNSQIRLTPSASNFAVNNLEYTLIDGEGGVAPNFSVVSDSPYLTVNSSRLATDLFATVSIAAAPEITQAGGSSNAQRAGSAITPLLSAMANSSPDNPVLNALAGSQAVQTSEQLVPQVNGASLQAANSLNNIANFNANQRTQGLRGASAGDTFVERGLWLKALGSEVSQDARDGIEGYDADLKGLAIGADGKLNDQLALGLAYSYLNSDIKADGGNTTQVDGHAITLYSGYEQGAWFVDSSLTLGLNHNDSKRYIAGTEAKGDYDSQMLGLDVLGGYGFNPGNGLLIEPRVAARYARVDIDSFREKGSIAALRVEDQRYEVAELGAGLRLAANLPLGQGSLQPQATLMAYHDFSADQIETQASFTFGGSSFLATGAKPARTRYEAGLGVDYVLANTTFGISYDYSGKQDFHADTLQAKVRYDF